MSNAIITVENLGKRYQILHQGQSRRSTSLREALTVKAASLVRGLTRRNGSRPSDEIESASTREEFWALRDVSFEVKQGEVLGIIGRNGAGKSTLLKILSRITEPTRGRIHIRGRVASLLEVGTGFHPDLTGRENVFLNGAILGMSRVEIKRKFDEIVAFSEVEKFLDTPVKRYSSGMYVRLAFAVAAHLEPEILLVDEVLAVGDVEFQRKCMGKMKDVSREGRTVFFVSHNIVAVKSLCRSALLMKAGKVVIQSAVDEVITEYLSNTRNKSGVILGDRFDRSGAGFVRMTQIWVEDRSSRLIDHALSGEQIVIAIEYESRGINTLKDVRVSLAFQNALEQPVFLCSTELVSSERLNCPPRGVVRCVIPRFPLSGGDYSLTAYFEVDGVAQDWVDNASSLRVHDGDFYGTGRLYPPGWQGKSVLIEHRWELPEV